MPHRNLIRKLAQSALELQQATRIGRGHRRGASLGDVTHLAFLKFCGHLRLRDIVYARAAATPHRLRKLDQSQTRNCSEDFSWLPGDLLTVAQMTSLVVSDGLWHDRRFSDARLSKPDRAKPLVNIANFR